MSDCLKCSLISLGIGMAAGIYVATTNKKVQKFVKDTEEMIAEKFDMAKQGVSDLKEQYVSEDQESERENDQTIKNSENKKNKKKK